MEGTTPRRIPVIRVISVPLPLKVRVIDLPVRLVMPTLAEVKRLG